MHLADLDAETSPDATDRQRWQLRRDLVITAAHTNGASTEILADVFDLDRSRIKQIIRQTRNRYAARTDQSGTDDRRGPRRFVA